jgi:MinD-like ATPase involved in chromosome partitioning or flagellar assembly
MATIISIHSFRGGTGKSNSTANIAALLAAEGQRVGVIDTDIQSPGIHVLFGLAGEEIGHTLNDYLWGRCDIRQTVHDVTANLGLGVKDLQHVDAPWHMSTAGCNLGTNPSETHSDRDFDTPDLWATGPQVPRVAEPLRQQPNGVDVKGRVFLIPSSIKSGEITRVLREGYDAQLLTRGFRRLIEELQLDVLLMDTHPGLGEETLLSIVISHTLAIILRPDQQDYEGTAVTVEVARHLKVPRVMLIVNKVPAIFDSVVVKTKVEQTYSCPVVAVLPHSEAMMSLASCGIFALRYPDHPLTAALRLAAASLVA